jgi:hypothetical protein
MDDADIDVVGFWSYSIQCFAALRMVFDSLEALDGYNRPV